MPLPCLYRADLPSLIKDLLNTDLIKILTSATEIEIHLNLYSMSEIHPICPSIWTLPEFDDVLDKVKAIFTEQAADTKNGISLLELKNHTVLNYLKSLLILMLKKVSYLKYFIECLFYWFAQVYVALLGPVWLIFFARLRQSRQKPRTV